MMSGDHTVRCSARVPASLSLRPERMRTPWQTIVEANSIIFDGLQHYHAATTHLEALEYGKQVARLGYAVNACAQAS